MSTFGSIIELSSLDGTDGFKINGEAASDYSGRSVASAGDINGDGYEDLIIGARGADPNGSDSGATYVVFGTSSGFDATLELSDLGSGLIAKTGQSPRERMRIGTGLRIGHSG